MIITNKLDLPEALVNAVSPEPHNAEGSLSATTLLHGTKDIILTKRHWHEIEEDCSSRLYALFGTAVHKIFEDTTDNKDVLKEEQFSCKISNTTLTGKVDRFDPKSKTIFDYKTTSVFKVIKANYQEWYTQLMIYAFLLSKAGYQVEHLMIYALLRDWSRTDAKINKGGDYPQSQIVKIPFDITQKDFDFIEKFITEKIADVESKADIADDLISPCTVTERWAEPAKWAVMPTSGKRAKKVCESKEEAEANCSEKDTIEFRPGKSKRCMDYCLCCSFCNFYKENVENAL